LADRGAIKAIKLYISAKDISASSGIFFVHSTHVERVALIGQIYENEKIKTRRKIKNEILGE
jgi:hypothetical protein